MAHADLRVLTFIPNLIGYFRIVLILVASVLLAVSDSKPITTQHQQQLNQQSNSYWSSCTLSLLIYGFSALLDAVDGVAARRLGQVSAFGAFLDVVVDTIGRTMLWHKANVKFLSWLVPCLEWLTFSCTHAQFGQTWKARFAKENGSHHRPAPSFVSKVFARGFYTLHGVFALSGIHCLPIMIVAAKQLPLINPTSPFLVSLTSLFLLFVLSSGRTYAACCEVWFIADHIRCLLTAPLVISQSTINAIRRQSITDFSAAQ